MVLLALAASWFTRRHPPRREVKARYTYARIGSTDKVVISRANKCRPRIRTALFGFPNSKGLVREYNGIDNVPDRINKVTGHYIAEAWASDSVSASFDKALVQRAVQNLMSPEARAHLLKSTARDANVVTSVKYAGPRRCPHRFHYDNRP